MKILWIGIMGWLATATAAGINTQNFKAAGNIQYFTTENALLSSFGGSSKLGSPDRRLYLGLHYDFINNPLTVVQTDNNQILDVLIDHIQTTELGMGFMIGNSFSIHAMVPFHFTRFPSGTTNTSLGDITVRGKFYLLPKNRRFGMAIIPEFTVPTGSTRNFVSDGSFQPGIHFAIENDFEPFKLAFNIGYRNAQNATYSTIDYRNRIIAKAAGSLPIVDWLNLNIEYQTAIRVPFDFSQSPSEFYLGGVSQIGKSFYLSTGATIGSFQEDASGNYGFFVGLEWTPFDPHEGEEIKTEALAPPVQKTKFVFKNKRIVIPKSIHFEFDSPALTPSGRSIVRQLAGFLKKNDAHFKKIIIEGHTDSAGKDAYNLVLSKQRAATVRRHLIYYGIEESRLQSEGYGESRPKYPWGSAKDQRGLNRRVEFIVID